jgi:hypothetical protein
MSELELLFVVLTLLYAWECACWVPRGTVAFRTWLGRRWQVAHPGTLLGNPRGGFVFAPPLPPLGYLAVAGQLPVSISSEAVLAHVAISVNPGGRAPQSGKCFRFDQIHSLGARGKRVRINDEVLVIASGPGEAARLALDLTRIWKSPPSDRPRAIGEWVRSRFDTQAVERLWRECSLELKPIRTTANLLFLWLFLVAPALIAWTGLARCWGGLVAGLLACTVMLARFFRRAHRKFYPGADDERFNHFLITLLAPVTAIRTHDLLTRPLLAYFHPLAVAKALFPADRFKEFATQVLRETRHPALPLCPVSDPVAQAAEKQTRELLLEQTERLLRNAGLNPDGLLAPPKAEQGCRAYCPRCLAQFTGTTGSCQDCGGLAVLAFAENAGTPTRGS